MKLIEGSSLWYSQTGCSFFYFTQAEETFADTFSNAGIPGGLVEGARFAGGLQAGLVDLGVETQSRSFRYFSLTTSGAIFSRI